MEHLRRRLNRYKACLVAQGYKQVYKIDYKETFTPVAKMTTMSALLAAAAFHNCLLWQMDVKNAFLLEDLHKTVNMQPPPGYVCPPSHVCHLQKFLYSLKQAPHAWFDKFRGSILQAQFYKSCWACCCCCCCMPFTASWLLPATLLLLYWLVTGTPLLCFFLSFFFFLFLFLFSASSLY